VNLWEEELEREFQELINGIANRYDVPLIAIINRLTSLLASASQQIISNNHFNNANVFFKAGNVQIVNAPPKVIVQKDETIHASSEEVASIKEKVKELAELIIKAHRNGVSISRLRLNFRITNPENPYPSIYDELKSIYKFHKLELLPKEKVKKVIDQLNRWIGSAAWALYKHGIPPYNRNTMIRKYCGACRAKGIDYRERALKKFGTDNLGEVDLLDLYRDYRTVLSKKMKAKNKS